MHIDLGQSLVFLPVPLFQKRDLQAQFTTSYKLPLTSYPFPWKKPTAYAKHSLKSTVREQAEKHRPPQAEKHRVPASGNRRLRSTAG